MRKGQREGVRREAASRWKNLRIQSPYMDPGDCPLEALTGSIIQAAKKDTVRYEISCGGLGPKFQLWCG